MPKNTETIYAEILDCYTDTFKDSLKSIYIYGSATTDDFNEKYSDINVAIILDDISIQNLIKARSCIKTLRKKNVTAPLFLTKEYIMDSLDSFPIEFLAIKSSHLTLKGDDLFADISVEPEHIRLQAERELKGKLLLLRASFLENIDRKNVLNALVVNSFSALIPVLKGILFFKGSEIPINALDVIKRASEVCEVDLSSFESAYKIKNRYLKLKSEEFVTFFESYISAVDSLTELVDKF
jgi:predicted nucleotidyltransferase